MSWPDYKTYPIIRLDMSDLTTDTGSDVLCASLLARVKENGYRLGVATEGAAIENAAPGDTFSGFPGIQVFASGS